MSDTNAQTNAQPSDDASPAAPEVAQNMVADAPATAPAAAPRPIAPRLAERKVVNGKAQIALGSGFSMGGKLIDLSEGGVCVMLDDPITIKKVCNISCNIFHNGKGYTFSLPSVVAYCVLVSGRGYKVGFQFGPRNAAASQAITDVLKSS
jgi:hypothetical protein